ncbi:4-hydroxy-tetrahydrodipicolinate synthase [Porphyromonas sp.]|uniref:4-hydroxy-tetrahydrodipicolinate synthase n=1 Tax=Porphyromonas sp. TaxID=1924944 RepID=UPI0026DB3D18|nr:4-hydroxy-tetrahydrodipicolinate synthase [Porphyromonas sp.]MDO4771815.1 4-hydroxy-tetrahydrodipicolinate synthase [Porphyromonas sp.]
METKTIKGMGSALITPFKEDDSVDDVKLEELTELQISGGADFIVAIGTTAESPTLTIEEQDNIIKIIKAVNKGRIPLVVGVCGNGTNKIIHRIKTMDKEGIDALLCVCPYYNKPTQEGLYRHFKAVSEASPLPIILYNIPARAAVNMLPETTLRIARECRNIIGIKEASGIVSQIDMIIKQRDPDFIVLSGDDTITYPLIAMGADGVISVIGNAFPERFSTMVRLARQGDMAAALPIHHLFKELYPLLFVEGNPSGIKTAMKHMGIINGRLRLPLIPMTDEGSAKMADALRVIMEQLSR